MTKLYHLMPLARDYIKPFQYYTPDKKEKLVT